MGHDHDKSKLGKLGLAGALISGFFASACCIGPLLMVFLGISSAGALVALEPYRPVFMGLSLLFLAIAAAAIYRRPRTACSESACRTNSRRTAKIVLWIGGVLTLGLILFPQFMLLFLD